MNSHTILRALALAVVVGLAGLQADTVTVTGAEDRKQLTDLERQVRKELITLPFYGVFDYFEFDVEGDRVVLKGQVSRPSLRLSAERVTARVEGVAEVENRIEVLPLSPFDNRIRRALLRAIYADSVLNRYAAGSNPWIRLIVRNGEITLEGFVDREADLNIANIRANGVANAFVVTNRLRIKS